MSNFKEKNELYNKWTKMRNYINKNSNNLSYDRITELRKQEIEIYNEWKKIDTIDKIKNKLNNVV